jgi:hypothetical protein
LIFHFSRLNPTLSNIREDAILNSLYSSVFCFAHISMSADLLAEFGDFTQGSRKEEPAANVSSGTSDLLVDFGSGFSNEAEAPQGPRDVLVKPETVDKKPTWTSTTIGPKLSLSVPPKSTSPEGWSRNDSPTWADPDPTPTQAKGEDLWRREEDGSDVLFDANTENPWAEDEFGDFGDFETATADLSGQEPVTESQDFPTAPHIASHIELPKEPEEKQDVGIAALDFVDDKPQAPFQDGTAQLGVPDWPLPTHHEVESSHTLPNTTKYKASFSAPEVVLHSPAQSKDDARHAEPSVDHVEDDWGDFMDAPAGDLEGDEAVSYPPSIPTISSSPPPELDLPTQQIQPNSEAILGFVPFERRKLPNLADLERPTSSSSAFTSDKEDGEDSPGWDWKVSAGSRSADQTSSKSMAPPRLLRPSLADAQRPSSFSTVASSDEDRSPGWDWKVAVPPDPVEHVRPFNIPPPSVILQLFPSLFERLQDRIFGETVSRSSDKLKDTSLLELGREVGAVSRVVGHVLAGRKNRWRRDTNLSQNMKIGQAQTGKGGGMKLTGVDKSENIKEEREAEDVLQTWKKYAGLFRSAVAGAGGNVVELSENMPTRTLGQTQGAFKATHACALCGLMRDERVANVDAHVEDSFGEWWTEHWGHLECRLFWEENQASLAQR